MITRLAPTPSGNLHWGNLYNFALTWNLVRRNNGVLWLRIDDVDGGRTRSEYVDQIFEVLNWLGFNWDQGPRDSIDFFEHYSQTLRKNEYFSKLNELSTYTCSCSRLSLLQRTGGSSVYDGHCSSLKLAFKPGVTSLRASLPDGQDPVVWTKEDEPSYHWVSVLDDLRMGVTDIVRGEDLKEATEVQMQLAKAMRAEKYLNIKYHFHKLLLDEQGQKLSKSKASDSINDFRNQGKTSSDVWLELSKRLGSKSAAQLTDFLL